MVGSRTWGAGTILALSSSLLAPMAARAQPSEFAAPGYRVTTAAAAATMSSTQSPPLSVVTADLVHATIGHAVTALDSSESLAQAATFYPGNLIAQGPQLLCQQFIPCPTSPPTYPLLAEATYPTQQEASAPQATASAKASSTQAKVRTTDVMPLGAISALVTIGAVDVSSSTRLLGKAADVSVVASLEDITIGPLRIAHLISQDTVRVSPGSVVDKPSVTLTGVTFLGHAATITDRGVFLTGSKNPDVATPSVRLDQLGLSVRLLGTDAKNGVGAARSSAGGLVVTFAVPVSSIPSIPNVPSLDRTYLGTLALGGVGVVVSADDTSGFTFPDLPSFPPPPGSLGSGPQIQSIEPVAVTSQPPAGSTASQPTVAAPTVHTRGFAQVDLSTLAAVLAIGVLGLFALSRALAWLSWRRDES